ncbi:MAG: hypothetical protein ACTS6P_00725 [Candidatus Hodgkinia cicadicola]
MPPATLRPPPPNVSFELNLRLVAKFMLTPCGGRQRKQWTCALTCRRKGESGRTISLSHCSNVPISSPTSKNFRTPLILRLERRRCGEFIKRTPSDLRINKRRGEGGMGGAFTQLH